MLMMFSVRTVLVVHGEFLVHNIRQLQGLAGGADRHHGHPDAGEPARHGTPGRRAPLLPHRLRPAAHGRPTAR